MILSGYGLGVSSVIDVAIGGPDGQPAPVVADPRKEYVASADVHGNDEIDRGFLAIEDRFRGPLAWHGIEEYERMYHTPIAGSCIDAIRCGVLANDLNLLPAVSAKALVPGSGQRKGSAVEADLAAEICESNKRLLAAWETPVHQVLWEHMDDLYLGHVLSEIVADDVVGGPDDGLLAIKAIRSKPRSTYQFRVDRSFNVIGIRAMAIDEATGSIDWKLFEPEHFLWSTNDCHRGDPRGRSVFRKAHYHWRLLMDLWPEVWKGWKQFGVPMTYGNTADAGEKMVPLTGKDGRPLPGPGVTREYAMAMTMARMRNGDSAAGPFGSNIKVIESTKDASVASGGLSLLEGQIIRSLHLQLRATTESKHGSRADSETGENLFGTVLRAQKSRREPFVRSALMRQNTWNYGADIAKRLTPIPDLGGTEHQDFAANAAGFGLLFQAAYPTEEMLQEWDAKLGFTPRRLGENRVGPNGVVSNQAAPEPGAPTKPAKPDSGAVGFTMLSADQGPKPDDPIIDIPVCASPIERAMATIASRKRGASQ